MPSGRRRSIRLKDFDYATPGAYFVTVLTHRRACLLSEIQEGALELTEIGQIVARYWLEIPRHFPHVELDEFILMPNHLHGIILLTERNTRKGTACRALTTERFGKPTHGSLPTIIRSFKSVATREVNLLRRTPGRPLWHRNYFERVIRNERELHAVRRYIDGNPLLWEKDEYYTAS